MNAQDNILPIVEDIFSEKKIILKTKTPLEETVNSLADSWDRDETTVHLLALEVQKSGALSHIYIGLSYVATLQFPSSSAAPFTVDK